MTGPAQPSPARTDAERAIAVVLRLRNRLHQEHRADLSVAQLLRAMDGTGTVLVADTDHLAARALEVIAATYAAEHPGEHR